uniref:Uncharacterized protein n=1 Tax=Anguilla anguilla TaxID=7936 RepID=A0A0E9UXT4_ANGAN
MHFINTEGSKGLCTIQRSVEKMRLQKSQMNKINKIKSS